MKKKKEIYASFVVAPPTAKVIATVHVECLVKMEKALNLWAEDLKEKHVLIDGIWLHQKALSQTAREPLQQATPSHLS